MQPSGISGTRFFVKITEEKVQSDEDITAEVVAVHSPEEAKGQQEMFLAGTVNGGIAKPMSPELSSKEELPIPIVVTKYPENSEVVKLDSPFQVKRLWIYNEWDPTCQFSKFILEKFSNRKDLHPDNPNPNIKLIESTFYEVRGKWALWGDSKEGARWKKVVVKKLDLNWVLQNVKVLYPTDDTFKVTEINGLVLWKDPAKRKYRLIEGNHRVSAWINSKGPQFLSSIIFIGKPAK